MWRLAFLIVCTLACAAGAFQLRGTKSRLLAIELLQHPTYHIRSTKQYDGHIQLVVARYKERMTSLGWIRRYPHIVYNHGDDDIDFNSTWKENVGREGHIYLTYLVSNYDKLANLTVFFQADSSENPPGINSTAFHSNLVALAERNITLPAESDGFAYLGIQNNCMSKILHWMKDRVHPKYESEFSSLFHFVVPNARFAPQALFAVTREVVHRNPLEYYQAILHRFDHGFGYFLEGAWPEVFHTSCSAHPTEFHCFPGPTQYDC